MTKVIWQVKNRSDGRVPHGSHQWTQASAWGRITQNHTGRSTHKRGCVII